MLKSTTPARASACVSAGLTAGIRRLAPIRSALALALAAWAVATLAVPAAAQPTVTGVRIGNHKTTARFVLDLNQPVRYKVFVLANPYRVIIDLPSVNWRTSREFTSRAGGPVRAFRFGAFTRGTSRVVLDLDRPMKVRSTFPLRPTGAIKAWRLVVDLEQVGETEFARLMRARRAGAKPPPGGPAAPVRKARRRGGKPLIVLDPGHGGVDYGASGPRGTAEKMVVLRFAKLLQSRLRKTKRYRVLLTRDSDYYVPLRKRYEIARSAGARLFISIHADSHTSRSANGFSVYTLSEKASDREAEELAKRENRSDAIAGVDLSGQTDGVAGILIDLAQRETMNLSAHFARSLVHNVRRVTRLLPQPHRHAGFAVLKAPDVPSVLVELGFLSNRREERLLRSRLHRHKLSASMVRAIDGYFRYVRNTRRRSRARHN